MCAGARVNNAMHKPTSTVTISLLTMESLGCSRAPGQRLFRALRAAGVAAAMVGHDHHSDAVHKFTDTDRKTNK